MKYKLKWSYLSLVKGKCFISSKNGTSICDFGKLKPFQSIKRLVFEQKKVFGKQFKIESEGFRAYTFNRLIYFQKIAIEIDCAQSSCHKKTSTKPNLGYLIN